MAYQPVNLRPAGLATFCLLLAVLPTTQGFLTTTPASSAATRSYHGLPATQVAATDSSQLQSSVTDLKKVLEREYISFFDPMERDYYSPTVSFEDPMTSLAGVDAYQTNVDMLASRTFLGKILFADAGIVLHSVTGGAMLDDGSIDQIVTRWTLRVTAKILPWSPTARFSGISVYDVVPGGSKGVMVEHQTDYWDSINVKPDSGKDTGGAEKYQKVDKKIAISDFLGQLKPENAIAPSAGPELPYQVLRRGDGYEVRRYPMYATIKLPYTRRDEAFGTLGAFGSGMSPLAPAIMTVSDDSTKSMRWPLSYAAPGETSPPDMDKAMAKVTEEQYQVTKCEVQSLPSQVVAVGTFSDASMEPVVRKADRLLRERLVRDGLEVEDGTEKRVEFAQYDAIFSMGKRRGETWIPLKDGGHPW